MCALECCVSVPSKVNIVLNSTLTVKLVWKLGGNRSSWVKISNIWLKILYQLRHLSRQFTPKCLCRSFASCFSFWNTRFVLCKKLILCGWNFKRKCNVRHAMFIQVAALCVCVSSHRCGFLWGRQKDKNEISRKK